MVFDGGSESAIPGAKLDVLSWGARYDLYELMYGSMRACG